MPENIYVPGTEKERFIELMKKLLDIEEILMEKENKETKKRIKKKYEEFL